MKKNYRNVYSPAQPNSNLSGYSLLETKFAMPRWMKIMYLIREDTVFSINNTHRIINRGWLRADADTILYLFIKYGNTPSYIKRIFGVYELLENIKTNITNRYGKNSIYGFIFNKFKSTISPGKNMFGEEKSRY